MRDCSSHALIRRYTGARPLTPLQPLNPPLLYPDACPVGSIAAGYQCSSGTFEELFKKVDNDDDG